MNKILCSLIIVTHNSDKDIKNFVSSFLEQNKKLYSSQIEFIFIENSGQSYLKKYLQPLAENDIRVNKDYCLR